MSQLHIFNPSHDEALAANSPYYYPAQAARTLQADLAVLPAWWAQSGDWILLPDGAKLPETDFTGHGVQFIFFSQLKQLAPQKIGRIQPWGWDPLLIHQLCKAGVSPNLLPSEQQMTKIRQLSSRQTAVQLLKAIRQDLPQTVGTSFWCTEEAEVWEKVSLYEKVMLKAPWSSSGRGVFAVRSSISDNVRLRVQRILKTQGAIEIEPFYDRTSDFALEFEAENNKIIYKGLSVFATTETGAYTGNMVGEEQILLQHLSEPTQQLLPQLINCLQEHLSTLIIPHYEGPLGIDLMTVRSRDGKTKLHPCVEINLRRTMGHVALALRSQIQDGQTAIYKIQSVLPSKNIPTQLSLTPYAVKMEAVLEKSLSGLKDVK